MWSHGSVFWSELNAHDPDRAKRFYAETVRWTFDGMPMEGGIYWAIKSGETVVGGIYEMKRPHFAKVPEHWLTYIAVDNVDARVEKTTAAAATVIHPAFDIGGVGRIVILREPGGAVVGWMTPSS